jgi:FMN-dependent NADH-azoreductase
MAQLLHLDASPRGERSHSRRLSKAFVDAWVTAHPGDPVTYRDLGHNPVPLVTEAMIAAAYTPPEARTDADRETLRLSDELIDELIAADLYVFGVPMYNFGVPAGFKAYIDQIVRVGRTFSVPDFRGLLQGKKLILAMSAGQDYSLGAPSANYDFVLPYLRAVFGFIGVTDIATVSVATNGGDDLLTQTETRARQLIAQLARSAA